MPERGAWIVGVGMVTPVGACAAQTDASVRAGVSAYAESPVHNKRFEPMTMALMPEDVLPPLAEPLAVVPGLTSRQTRMLRLAGAALQDLFADVQPVAPNAGAPPLLLALPEVPPEGKPAAHAAFLQHLAQQAGPLFDLSASNIFPTGRAAGLQALAAALDLLEQGRSDSVLVGGVDTHLDLYLLASLDQENRVLANGVMDGFCPGEGAAFLLLTSESRLSASGLKPMAFVHRPGVADEPGHRYSENPYKGEGLAQAIQQALAPVPEPPVRTVLCSMNGENIGAKEWGVSYLRSADSIAPDFKIEHPAEFYGDPGAATAPLLLGLGALGAMTGNAPGPCLVWCSSDGPLRGAARLAATPD